MRSLHVVAAVACAALAQLGVSAFQAAPDYQERDFLTRTRRITVEQAHFDPHTGLPRHSTVII